MSKRLSKIACTACRRFILQALPVLAMLTACSRSVSDARQGAAIIVLSFSGPADPSHSALVLGHYNSQTRTIDSGLGGLVDPLQLSRLASIKHEEEKWFGGDVVLASPAASNATRQAVAVLVPPGTYVVSRFTLQDRWGLCFHDASQSFTIQRGDVLSLGEIDDLFYAQELRRRVERDHTERLHGAWPHDYVSYDAVPAVRFLDTSDGNTLGEAQRVATQAFPRFTTPIRPAQLSPATFGVASSGFLASKHCGAQ